MVNCKICGHPYCEHAGTQRGIVVRCDNYMPPQKPKKPQTNADRIRAMSDEELAVWLSDICSICDCCAVAEECSEVPGYEVCRENVVAWLRQPVKDGED